MYADSGSGDGQVQAHTSELEHTVALLRQEIDKHRQTEKALRRNDSLLQQAQRIAHIGSWEWNPAGNRLLWSDELYRIYGYEPGSVAPSRTTLLDLMVREDRIVTGPIIQSCLRDASPCDVECRIQRPDGILRYIHEHSEFLRDEEGQLIHIGTVQDITDRVQAEQTIDETMRRIQQAERLAVTGRLAAGVAHEINNPLQVLMHCCAVIQDGIPDPDVRERLQRSLRSIQSTVHRLLDLHRTRPQQQHAVDVNSVIHSTLNLLQNQLSVDKILVTLHLDETLPPVTGSTQGLAQIIMNLVMNARDAMCGGGQLTIATDYTSNTVLVHVTDTGIGIAPTEQDHIFDPFYTTKSEAEGTGLGLFICRQLMQEYRGEIGVRSQLHEGTCLTLSFPAGSPV